MEFNPNCTCMLGSLSFIINVLSNIIRVTANPQHSNCSGSVKHGDKHIKINVISVSQRALFLTPL